MQDKIEDKDIYKDNFKPLKRQYSMSNVRSLDTRVSFKFAQTQISELCLIQKPVQSKRLVGKAVKLYWPQHQHHQQQQQQQPRQHFRMPTNTKYSLLE